MRMPTNNESVIRVLYIGLHPGTLHWINRKPFDLVGVSKLEYFARWSWNPANLIFGLCYGTAIRFRSRSVRFVFRVLWSVFAPVASGPFRRYRQYLASILWSRISIVDAEDIDVLKKFITNEHVDLMVVNSWSLLPADVIALPRFGVVNIHPSRLPQYRGALPTLWSLKNNDSDSAVTLMCINASVDDGGILSQYGFSLKKSDTSLNVERKIDRLLEIHLHADLVHYVNGDLVPHHQEGIPTTTGKYYAYLQIKWSEETAREIANKILLYPYLEPFQYCWTLYCGKKLKFKQLRPTEGVTMQLSPGVFVRSGTGLLIGTTDRTMHFRLFRDVSYKSSLRLMLESRGTFDEICK